MNSFYLDSLAELEIELRAVKSTVTDNLNCYEKSKSAAIKTFHCLKMHLKQNPFADKETEIHFFKHILPKVISKVHLYSLLYKHENKKIGYPTTKSHKLHCKRMLKQINSYHSEYQYIITYYKSGKCNLDDFYFLRRCSDYPGLLEDCEALVDKEFSTGYDLIIARHIAYEEYATILSKELNLIEFDAKTTTLGEGGCFLQNLQWTGTKIELIELMYALLLKGSINNSQIKLKELAEIFEKFFQVDFGDYFHTFSEIKNRKNPTLFIDNLRKALIKKIDEKEF